MADPGRLRREIAEIPELIRARANATAHIASVAAEIRACRPRFALTIGRGSSDAVCEGLARALGSQLGLVTASLSPSLVTVDQAKLRCDGALALVVSQSGRSPDIIAAAHAVRAAGALVVGILNDPRAPLADACDHLLLAGAHPERSVAATKSVMLSWLTGLMLIADIAGRPLHAADVDALAGAVADAQRLDLTPMAARLSGRPLILLSRGAGHAVAREMALKLRELSGLPAEAFSTAEFLHGPRAALTADTALVHVDAAGASPWPDTLPAPAATLRIALDQDPTLLSDDMLQIGLPAALPAQVAAPALCAAAYPLALLLAEAAGRDPDSPEGLSKVTLTM